MIDIVIPLGKSKIDYLDLRYALRSIEKHLKGYRDIYIIGEKPKWIKNVKHIHFSDDSNPVYKERNIYRKILRAIEEDSISEQFLFTNDDIFILIDYEQAVKFPFYHKGELQEAIDKNFSNYRITLSKTERLLGISMLETLNFDIHTPIVYSKRSFMYMSEDLDFDSKFGYAIKSLYGNFNDRKVEYMEDCKFTGKITYEEVKKRSEGRSIISCNDAPLKYGLKQYLEELFPNKSKYEI